MQQTKLESLLEVCLNVAIGWVVALITQLIVFPKYGFNPTFGEQFGISVIFTVVSIVRGYIIRRWFNAGIHKLVAQFVKKMTQTS
jgi:hypothetical protein